jgi:ABC-type sugar transport system permease subunit
MKRPGQRPIHVWGFLLPALVLLGLFVVWPMLRAVGWSFQHVGVLNPDQTSPAGWGNYSWMLSDDRYRQAFANTARFALMVVPVQTALSLALALWVNRPEPAWRWLRTVFFLPVVISMPVLAVLWKMLYQPLQGEQMGMINAMVTAVGLPAKDWLQDPALALPAIALMSVWQGVGFQMMMFLAGLQNLSSEQLEAARIDGAGAWARFRYVILPGLRHTVVFVVVATTLLSFRLFVQPYLMTRGGPEGSTVSWVQVIYESTFLSRDLGLAGAGTVLLLLMVAVPTALRFWVDRRRAA